MKLLKVTIVLVIAAMGLAAAALLYLDSPANPGGETVSLLINQGENAADIGQALESRGLIKSRFYFLLVARAGGWSKNLKSGTFEISPALTTRRILHHLANSPGKVREFKVTIPEGFTALQIAERLESHGVCHASDFMDVVARPRKSGVDTGVHDIRNLEGFLFPDTYFLDDNSNCVNTAQRMMDQFFKMFTPKLENRARKLGFSLNEAVTLASLIEKEARADSERARISGVLHNRLKAGMLLQCDATIQYVLPERKEKLYYKHLEEDSPYNTYLHKGLPPGPICSPGADSLSAALQPEDTKFYYYVARPDGTHIFSRNNNEHINAKQRAKNEYRQLKNGSGR
ncbi:endolytic transglycosylase MltG [bacterium]